MKAFDPKLHGVLDQTLLEVGIVEIIRANASPGYEDRVPARSAAKRPTPAAKRPAAHGKVLKKKSLLFRFPYYFLRFLFL